MFHRYDLRKNYPNGDSYNGEATEDNVKDGKGTYMWKATGASYTGEWKKNVMHGSGTLSEPSHPPDTKNGFKYIGQFNKGVKSGKGQCWYDTGREYSGDWVEDVPHGEGMIRAAAMDNFVEYHGPFSRGLRHGHNGQCVYGGNGESYHGDWEQDQRHGRGEQQFAADRPEMSYSGTFHHDTITGSGVLRYRNGEEYEGSVMEATKHGAGRQIIPSSNTTYVGEFVNNYRHGSGEIQVAGSYSYKGGWYYGQWEGEGQLSVEKNSPLLNSQFRSILNYVGSWHSSECHGKGKATFADGSVYEGSWAANYPHGSGKWTMKPMTFPVEGASLSYEGDFAEGLPHGSGSGKFHLPFHRNPRNPAESLYVGQWHSGLPSGPSGKWRYHNGDSYVGTVEHGLREGQGTLTVAAGHKYTGQFHHDLKHGKGRIDFRPSQDHYEGDWLEDQYHGQGIYHEYETSNSYTGQWEYGKKHGVGTQIEYGKSHFHGAFANDLKNGYGTLKFNNGTTYEGYFEEGEYSGKGRLALQDGTLHEGEFRRGQCHGLVETKFTTGNTYNGLYVDGVIAGEGEMIYTNKDKYVGEFKNGERSGSGKFIFAEGAVLHCVWRNNTLHGSGVYIARDGTKKLREYADGVLVRETLPDGTPSTSLPVVTEEHPPAAPTPQTINTTALHSQQAHQSKQPFEVPVPPVMQDVADEINAMTSPPPQSSSMSPPLPEEPVGGHQRESLPSPPKVVALSLGAIASPQHHQPTVAPITTSNSSSTAVGGDASSLPPSSLPRTKATIAQENLDSVNRQINELQQTIDDPATEAAVLAQSKKKLALFRATRLREQRQLQKFLAEEATQ